MIAELYRVCFRADENILKLAMVIAQVCENIKSIEWYNLKG